MEIMQLPVVDDFTHLFVRDIPMLDVRAPVEFQRGAFPHAVNMPLINDSERQAIGQCYKNEGQARAVDMGHRLVSGAVKEERIAHWLRFYKDNPQGVLYCFRGGMRSKISQQWIYEKAGVMIPRIKGGYKALRRFLLEQMQQISHDMSVLILSGRTGCGKTALLDAHDDKLDLEALFRHRGSAFGNTIEGQPGQVDIENSLAIELIKLSHYSRPALLIEDEAPNIGSRRIPECLLQRMQQGAVILLETGLEQRVENIYREYIELALNEYQSCYGHFRGFQKWSHGLLQGLDKIRKRLGGQRYQSARAIMETALYEHRDDNPSESHKVWIKALLQQYYDPMYDYQLSKKNHRIIFRGEQEAIECYLRDNGFA